MTFQITTPNNGSDSLQFRNFNGNLLASITSFDTTGAGNLIVQTNNTNALWLDSKQNLGLGSTPSSWGAGSNALQVGTYASIWSQSSTNQYIYSNAYYNGTNDIFLSSNPAARIRFASGTTIFNYTSSGTSGNTVSWLESMRIDNSGNFYVGTTSQSPNTTALMTLWQGASSTKPSIQFTTGNDTNWWGRITASNAGGTIGQFYSSGGAWTVSGTTFSAVKDYNGTFPTSAFFIANQYNSSTSSYFAWLTQAAGSSTTDGAVTQLMTLTNAGYLGIGATSPNNVVSAYVSGSATNIGYDIQASGGTYGRFAMIGPYGTNNDIFIGTVSNNALRIYANNSEVARFVPGTQFLIGCTSSTVSGVGFSIYQGQTSVLSLDSYRDSSKQFVISNNNGNTSIYSGNGASGVVLYQNSTSWGTFSDSRLKNITGTYTTPLTDIAQIQAVKYTWKNDSTNKAQVGVIAQSVLPVVPEAVEEGENFGDTSGTLYYSVKYTELIPLMIASIQALTTELTALKEKVGA